MYISKNHTPFYVPTSALRRMKDVHVIVITTNAVDPNNSRGLESTIVSLKEAEAIRFAVHTRQIRNHCAAVCTPAGTLLTHWREKKLESHTCPELLLCRFFNSEMRFRDDEKVNEIIPLITLLSRAPTKLREQFFAGVAKCRRRLLHGWETSTLAQVFRYENDSDVKKFRNMSEKVRAKLKLIKGTKTKIAPPTQIINIILHHHQLLPKFSNSEIFQILIPSGHSSLLSYFKEIDTDNDGLVHFSDLLTIFTKLQVELEENELKELVTHVCQENKGWMSYRQFFNHFSVNLGAKSRVCFFLHVFSP